MLRPQSALDNFTCRNRFVADEWLPHARSVAPVAGASRHREVGCWQLACPRRALRHSGVTLGVVRHSGVTLGERLPRRTGRERLVEPLVVVAPGGGIGEPLANGVVVELETGALERRRDGALTDQ